MNINDVVANLMCTTAPMGGWKESGIGARFGGDEAMRKYCRLETVVEPKQMMWMALRRPRRVARDR